MKPLSSSPTLDLVQVDAVVFCLDEILLTTDHTQGQTSREHKQRTLSSAMNLARELKICHIKTALVTAGTNGAPLYTRAGLSEVFDAQVHGGAKEFLKASQLLDVSPGRTAIIDCTQAGVEAARADHFGVIVGLTPLSSRKTLKTDGADVVITDLCDLPIRIKSGLIKRNTMGLPSGLHHHLEIVQQVQDKSVIVFLDYDGTLTPIVARPELATLPDNMRETLRKLAKHCPVGVISGRDRVNLQQLVNVDSLIYAGSHGFDISGPKNLKIQHEMGTQFLPILDHVEASLHEQLDSIDGTLIERKKYSVAVHYRLVGSQGLHAVRSAVEAILSQHSDIRAIHGKKLYDLQPRIDWDKGKALMWLLEALNIPRDQAVTFFLGDDVTDEDAFRVLQDENIGIIVENTERYTYATYRLNNPEEVDQFLRYLTDSTRKFFS